jgi:UDP-galactopyranose mutase
MTKVLIIGGGPAGCIAAHFLNSHGFRDVTIVEKAGYLGGSCKTLYHFGHPYTLGPRHFLTKIDKVWDYMHQHCPMKRYHGHEFFTFVKDEGFYHFPIHVDEVKKMPDYESKIKEELANVPGAANAKNLEEYWIFSVGETLYNKFVKHYSNKMWKMYNNQLITDFGFSPKGVALKSGPIKGAWSEAYSGFPLARNGYDDYFELATADSHVRLNTTIQDFNMEHKQVKIDNAWSTWDIIINTISPEILYESCYGPLRWMGRDFLKIVLPVKEALPENAHFLYYANEEPFTRIVEYCKFSEWDKESPTTLLGIEIPSYSNKLYPYPMKADQEAAQKYLDMLPQDVHSIGRMGSYRYLDMGGIIDQCFGLMEKL